MKWAIALTVTLLVASSGAALAQQPPQTASLADVARAEEARRKTAKKATKMLTNASLTAADGSIAETPAAPAASATPAGTAAVPDDEPDEPAQAGEKKDQAYWAKRISQARAELSRSQMFAESMQTRLNVLAADLVNLGYPARGVAEQQRNKLLAELERTKKEIEQKTKDIVTIEDEARRANVPPGWLRP